MAIIATSHIGEETFFANENGRPFTKENFGNWLRAHMESESYQPHLQLVGPRT
jgi:hypothetical protein